MEAWDACEAWETCQTLIVEASLDTQKIPNIWENWESCEAFIFKASKDSHDSKAFEKIKNLDMIR